MNKRRLLLAAALMTLGAQAVQAEEAIEWNGFLNIIGGILKDAPVVDFSNNKQHPGYQGYEDALTFSQQTSAGLQAQKRFDDKTSATFQLYAEGDNDDYDANLKWLYLRYEPTYHSSFRVGRIGAPIYYFSDYLNVGYAYHWIKPPEAVYPFDTTIDGIDYVYQNVWQDFDWSVELLAGASDDYFPLIASRVISRNCLGATFSISTGGWLSFRAMLFQSQVTFEVDALAEDNLNSVIETVVDTALVESGLPESLTEAFRPTLLADTQAKLDNGALDLEDFRVTYGDIALRAETQRWLLMTEWISIRSDTYLYNNLVSGFVTGGVHVGPVLYHLTFSGGKSDPHDDVRADLLYSLPVNPQISDYSDALSSTLRTKLAGAFGRRHNSASLGMRIETSANTALKFEITHIEEKKSFDGDTFGVGKNLLFRTGLYATF